MVEKIIVSPQDVRAYGNVVEEKELEDYESFRCSVTDGSDVINGVDEKVFNVSGTPAPLLTISNETEDVRLERCITISSSLEDSEGNALIGKQISLKEGETVLNTIVTSEGDNAFKVILPLGLHQIYASFDGDDVYCPAVSEAISLAPAKSFWDVEYEFDEDEYSLGDTAILSGTVGTVVDEIVDGEVVTQRIPDSNVTLSVTTSQGSRYCSTNSRGEFALQIPNIQQNQWRVNIVATDTHLMFDKLIRVPVHDYRLFIAESESSTSTSRVLAVGLTDMNTEVEGARIMIEGSDGSSYTCVTDSMGEASVNLGYLLDSITYTARYDGLSASCTVGEPILISLQQYLLGTSNYGYAQGSASKLSIVNSNELRGSASVICMNNDAFTDSMHYTLTFDWKMSRGYEGGFVMGDESDYWAFSQQTNFAVVQHGSGSNDSGGGDSYQVIQSSQRFTDYVPVVITRDGDDWTIDVDNGGLEFSFTADHSNRFGIRVWSGYCYVKNLKLNVHHLLYDEAVSDNSSILFGVSVPLRNSGANTVAWNNEGHYLLTNTGSQKESMRILKQLTGETGDFIFEYDSYIEGTSGSSGFVVYNGNISWEKLTDDGDSTRRTWYGYNNGSFHEFGFNSSIVTNGKWVHYKYIVQGNVFSIEITYEGNVLWSYAIIMNLARNENTRYGLDCEWQSNTKTRYRNLRAYVL